MATHEWHSGELALQSALGHVDAVAGAHPIFRPQLTAQHQQFHTSLQILPVATLDSLGRPWASFLTGRDGSQGFISSPSFTSLIAGSMRLHEDHPVEIALREGAKFGMTSLVRGDDTSYQGPGLKLIAGVGVMFENRRRNKFAGFINERNVGTEEDRTIQVEVMESLGNCPKYINTRQLIPNPSHKPEVLHKKINLSPGEPLPEETQKHISQADAVFLATRYTSPVQMIFKSKLGVNIRGGKPGFLRITTETITNEAGEKEQRQVAYLPDYSGNRFMSSLGNTYSDGVAGITVPLMQKGKPIDVVYLTGNAQILLGKDSTRVFPGVNTCVRIELTGFMHVKDAVPLIPSDGVEDFEQKGEDGVGWSPYNPPVRRLASELSSLSSDPTSTDVSLNEATITNLEEHTPELATFTFTLNHPVKYRAGQHIILDCGSLLDAEVKEYKHMSEKYNGEKELNDTGVRTWTISSAPQSLSAEGEKEVRVTMRWVEKGLVTPKLFEVGKKGQKGWKLPVLGVGGDFVLPNQVQRGSRRFLWVASGVGITPFLSFLEFLSNSDQSSSLEITLILAVRRAEVQTMLNLVNNTIASEAGTKGILDIHIVSAGLTDTDLPSEQPLASAFERKLTKHSTRLSPESLLEISSGMEKKEEEAAEAWVCGPPALETLVVQTLEKAGWAADKVHRERALLSDFTFSYAFPFVKGACECLRLGVLQSWLCV